MAHNPGISFEHKLIGGGAALALALGLSACANEKPETPEVTPSATTQMLGEDDLCEDLNKLNISEQRTIVKSLINANDLQFDTINQSIVLDGCAREPALTIGSFLDELNPKVISTPTPTQTAEIDVQPLREWVLDPEVTAAFYSWESLGRAEQDAIAVKFFEANKPLGADGEVMPNVNNDGPEIASVFFGNVRTLRALATDKSLANGQDMARKLAGTLVAENANKADSFVSQIVDPDPTTYKYEIARVTLYSKSAFPLKDTVGGEINSAKAIEYIRKIDNDESVPARMRLIFNKYSPLWQVTDIGSEEIGFGPGIEVVVLDQSRANAPMPQG